MAAKAGIGPKPNKMRRKMNLAGGISAAARYMNMKLLPYTTPRTAKAT